MKNYARIASLKIEFHQGFRVCPGFNRVTGHCPEDFHVRRRFLTEPNGGVTLTLRLHA
jgi:hypothetical protein